MTFDTFNVEPADDCLFDSVSIYDGTGEDGQSLGVFCGHDLPSPIISIGSSATVVFQSDEVFEYPGFKLQFEATSLAGACH